MSESRRNRAQEIQDAIRQLLYRDWDPIGVRGAAPEDEYDSYIAGVYRILTSSRSEDALVQFLAHAAEGMAGSPEPSSDGLRSVARKLLALDVAQRTLRRAAEARDRGELWRAKEILQGRLASERFDPDLYRAYGEVLLEMGDLVEAGKYLFLSGVRNPDFDRPIDLYLGRFAKSTVRHLHSSFPSRARLLSLTDLPEAVTRELVARGFAEPELRKAIPGPDRLEPKDRLVVFVVLSVLVILIAFFFIGVVNGALTMWSWLD